MEFKYFEAILDYIAFTAKAEIVYVTFIVGFFLLCFWLWLRGRLNQLERRLAKT